MVLLGVGLGRGKLKERKPTKNGEEVKILVYKNLVLTCSKIKHFIIILSSHMPEISLKSQNGKIYDKQKIILDYS